MRFCAEIFLIVEDLKVFREGASAFAEATARARVLPGNELISVRKVSSSRRRKPGPSFCRRP